MTRLKSFNWKPHGFHQGRLPALAALLIGVVSILGWALDIATMRRMLPGLISIKFNTALSILLLALAVGFSGAARGRLKTLTGLVFPALVFGIGLATLCEYVLGWDFHIDQLFFPDTEQPRLTPPGRMSIISAVILCLASAAQLMRHPAPELARLRPGLILTSLFLATASLLAYLYGATGLLEYFPYKTIAPQTAVAFIFIGMGQLFSLQEPGVLSPFRSHRIGGILGRRLLPLSIFTLLAIGFITSLATRLLELDPSFDGVIVVSIGIFALSWLIWKNAQSLNSIDESLEQSRQALQKSRDELERRVLERTDELASLYREARRAKLVADNMPAMLAYWDKDQRCRFANRIYLDWFGIRPEDLIGRPIWELLGKQLYEKNWPYIKGALEGRTQFFERDLVLHTTGEVRHTNAMYIPEIADGEVLGFFVLVVDVTDLKRAQLAATSAKEKAEAAVRVREEVLAVVSHDLRSPLSTIGLTAEMLKRVGKTDIDRVHDYSHRIQRAVDQMQKLIGNLLDFAKLESGTFSLDKRPEKPESVVLSVVQNFQTLAEAKHLRLQVEIPPGLPDIVCDIDRISQTLSNLLGNAVKFTPEDGAIRVSATETGEGVMISVSDTGPGIPPDQLPKVFAPFWQAVETRKLGSGLGLYIAKGIVEAHGGKIRVENNPGKGACFSFTIPSAASGTGTDAIARPREKIARSRNHSMEREAPR